MFCIAHGRVEASFVTSSMYQDPTREKSVTPFHLVLDSSYLGLEGSRLCVREPRMFSSQCPRMGWTWPRAHSPGMRWGGCQAAASPMSRSISFKRRRDGDHLLVRQAGSAAQT